MNIELHLGSGGFGKGNSITSETIRFLIMEGLRKLALPAVVRETIITVAIDDATDSEGKFAPFVRVISDHPEHFAVAVGALKRIEALKRHEPPIGVECVPLSEYHEL